MGGIQCDSVSLVYQKLELNTTANVKSLCCFTFSGSEGSTTAQSQSPNPAAALFTTPPASAMANEGNFPRCANALCTHPEITSANDAAAHALLQCSSSNSFICPLCHQAGTLLNVNTHDDHFVESLYGAFADHVKTSCSAALPCTRCGPQVAPHHLREHVAEDSAMFRLGQLLLSCKSIYELINLPVDDATTTLRLLSEPGPNNPLALLLNHLVLAFGNEVLAFSLHRYDIDVTVFAVKQVFDIVLTQLQKMQKAMDTCCPEARGAAQDIVAKTVVTVDEKIIGVLHRFASDVLMDVRMQEGARFMPRTAENQLSRTTWTDGFVSFGSIVVSPLPAIGWLFYRLFEVFTRLSLAAPITTTLPLVEPQQHQTPLPAAAIAEQKAPSQELIVTSTPVLSPVPPSEQMDLPMLAAKSDRWRSTVEAVRSVLVSRGYAVEPEHTLRYTKPVQDQEQPPPPLVRAPAGARRRLVFAQVFTQVNDLT